MSAGIHCIGCRAWIASDEYPPTIISGELGGELRYDCPFCLRHTFAIPGKAELNALQDAGIISDNCVTWAEVADVDKERALKWLAVQKGALF